MAAIDDIQDLAQDVFYTINGAENDDTASDLTLFQNGFIRAFNIWLKEYETEAYWHIARVNDLVLATIADTTTFTFPLAATYRTPVFDQNKYLKFVLSDGTIISKFVLVDPDKRQVDDDLTRPDRATFLTAGRAGGGNIVLSRPPRATEVGAQIVLDVVKMFPKLTAADSTVLSWIYNDAIATYGIAKNVTRSDVTKVSLSPTFAKQYLNELNKALNINNASNEADQMQTDDYSNIGGDW
jgi:hypothetical protein